MPIGFQPSSVRSAMLIARGPKMVRSSSVRSGMDSPEVGLPEDRAGFTTESNEDVAGIGVRAMPLLRSLMIVRARRCYKHGAPNGAFCAAPIRGRSAGERTNQLPNRPWRLSGRGNSGSTVQAGTAGMKRQDVAFRESRGIKKLTGKPWADVSENQINWPWRNGAVRDRNDRRCRQRKPDRTRQERT